MSKAEKLRQMLGEKDFLLVMGGHNALGAKLIEMNGFDGVWASGFEISTAHGVPDANILTMTENLVAASDINEATTLPVICDCDTGYGNASNVMHMVRKYEAADIAAVVIEDKHFPKINSFIPGRQELASIEEFTGKIEAARSVRKSPSGIMIFARVEALIAGWDMGEALRRAVAYYEAGADGIVIHSKSHKPDEVFTFAKFWKEKFGSNGILIAIPTTYYEVTAQELAGAGFKIGIYANQGIRTIVRALNNTFGRIREEGGTRSIEKNIASMQEVFQLQGMPIHQEIERRFSQKNKSISAVIPAAADHKFQPALASHLRDLPLCMLEVGGKSLLEHQLDLLRSVGIYDFWVVTGYQQETIQAQGIHKIENLAYAQKGSAHSIMLGLENVSGKTVVCYSDIIFDRQLPEALLDSDHPITLVIDRAFRTLPRRDKVLDRVLTQELLDLQAIRKINVERFNKILRIGKKIETSAQHEFVGIMLLSQEGVTLLKRSWREACKKFAAKRFYEAPGVEQASLTDLIQYLIDQGTDIYGLVVEHGWSEIYSLDDYERVNHYFLNNTYKNTPSTSVSR